MYYRDDAANSEELSPQFDMQIDDIIRNLVDLSPLHDGYMSEGQNEAFIAAYTIPPPS